MKRKKKSIKIAAALLTAALIVLLLCVVGCQGRDVAADPVETTAEPTSEATEAPTEHIHVYSEEIVEPGCTERGYTLFVCACGEDSYKDKFVDALGHDWSAWATVEEATEEKAGMEERKCARCGETENRDMPKVIPGHEHEYVESVAVPATCTESGVMAYICECGGSFTNPIDPLGHDYKLTTVAPTCGEKGYTRHTCKRCGDTYDDGYTNATGKHSWGKWETVKAATCGKGGSEKRTCSVCKASETRNTNPTNNHSWGKWTETKAPTYTETGIESRKCSVCGATENRVIDKLVKPTEPKPTEPKPTEPPVTEAPHKHSYKWVVTKAATCTKDGTRSYVCDCGDVNKTETITATGHKYSLTSTKAGTCKVKGSETYTCSVCGDVDVRETSYGDHNWVENGRSAGTCKVKGHIDYICSNANCNATRSEDTDYGDHNWVHRHTDEVGHEEAYYVCHCGGWSWKCANGDPGDSWYNHIMQYEDWAEHSYYSTAKWVVDTKAQDYDECTICGTCK